MSSSSAAAGPSSPPERKRPEEGLTGPIGRGYRARMETRVETGERSPLLVLLGTLGVLGLLRVAGRLYGFLALLGIVIGSVLALTVGILVLKLLVLR